MIHTNFNVYILIFIYFSFMVSVGVENILLLISGSCVSLSADINNSDSPRKHSYKRHIADADAIADEGIHHSSQASGVNLRATDCGAGSGIKDEVGERG